MSNPKQDGVAARPDDVPWEELEKLLAHLVRNGGQSCTLADRRREGAAVKRILAALRRSGNRPVAQKLNLYYFPQLLWRRRFPFRLATVGGKHVVCHRYPDTRRAAFRRADLMGLTD